MPAPLTWYERRRKNHDNELYNHLRRETVSFLPHSQAALIRDAGIDMAHSLRDEPMELIVALRRRIVTRHRSPHPKGIVTFLEERMPNGGAVGNKRAYARTRSGVGQTDPPEEAANRVHHLLPDQTRLRTWVNEHGFDDVQLQACARVLAERELTYGRTQGDQVVEHCPNGQRTLSVPSPDVGLEP